VKKRAFEKKCKCFKLNLKDFFLDKKRTRLVKTQIVQK